MRSEYINVSNRMETMTSLKMVHALVKSNTKKFAKKDSIKVAGLKAYPISNNLRWQLRGLDYLRHFNAIMTGYNSPAIINRVMNGRLSNVKAIPRRYIPSSCFFSVSFFDLSMCKNTRKTLYTTLPSFNAVYYWRYKNLRYYFNAELESRAMEMW